MFTMERLEVELFDAQRTQQQWSYLRGRNPGLVGSASELRSRDQQRDMRVLVLHSAISRRPSISRRDPGYTQFRLQDNVGHSSILIRQVQREPELCTGINLLNAERGRFIPIGFPPTRSHGTLTAPYQP